MHTIQSTVQTEVYNFGGLNTSQSYSHHKILDRNSIPFNPDDYSRFKFGDEHMAKKFGYELANGFIQNVLSKNPINKQIVVITSPYYFVTPAATLIKNYFIRLLNQYLIDAGLSAAQETKIDRIATYTEDYGKLPVEERFKLISRDTFHIDKQFIKNKVLLFLDDIRITGTHEKMIQRMIDQYELDNDCFFLYYAELLNNEVSPDIEDFLNHSFVKSLGHVDVLIKDCHYSPTLRAIKYILNSSQEDFENFMAEQNLDFIENLYYLSIGEGYYGKTQYRDKLHYLKNNYINPSH